MTAPDLGANLVAMFRQTAARRGAAPFLWAKVQGSYQPWSWQRVAEEASLLARCLAQLGIAAGDRVLIVSENRPEWCIADLAILTAGAVAVPAYTTNTVEDHAYLLGHSEAKAVICSGHKLAKRLLPAVRQSPAVRFLLFIEPLDEVGALPVSALSWADALSLGGKAPAVDHAQSLTRNDLACFIYTSGTGGRPKGVMLSHGNIMANIEGVWSLLGHIQVDDDETFLSFLPLSHAYEHTAGQFLPIAMGAQIYYAEGVETLSTNLVETKPTFLCCVPRLYEVLRQRITAGVERQGGMQKRLFDMALDLGRRRYANGGQLPLPTRLADALLDRLVRAKIRERFGGRMKAMISGGAPLNHDVGLFFVALGLPVLQGYGQTEAAPIVSVNIPGRAKLDTVGPPLEGVEVKIAPDGEILVRGDLVMKGYWKDEAATAAALRDGWLHTGDIGEIDEEGRIRITDRKKDIIVNSGGDNIAPGRVEGILLLQPEIGQALVYGDRRPHLVALIVPHPDLVKSFARAHKKGSDQAALASDPAFKTAIGEAVTRANRQLSAIERIRKFHVMPESFTVDNGMLTPTLKLRRHIIVRAYKDLLESLYASGK